MIDRFSGTYRFLSNFYPSVVKLDGIEYPSVEHAYQAAKTFNEEQRARIRRETNPGGAKRLGQKVKLRPDWESVKVSMMRDLLFQKFAPGTDLAAQLLGTGDEKLVEGNTWNDRFWGVCNGEGQNRLGNLLMEVRTSLRDEQC